MGADAGPVPSYISEDMIRSITQPFLRNTNVKAPEVTWRHLVSIGCLIAGFVGTPNNVAAQGYVTIGSQSATYGTNLNSPYSLLMPNWVLSRNMLLRRAANQAVVANIDA